MSAEPLRPLARAELKERCAVPGEPIRWAAGLEEHSANAESARLQRHTDREQLSRRHIPKRYAGELLRESIRVFLLSGTSKLTVSAMLRSVADDITTGRPLGSFY